MTIEKGQQWGEPVDANEVDVDAVVVIEDDAELARLAYAEWLEGRTLQASLNSGDLLATLGLDAPRPVAEQFLFPIDLGMAKSGSESFPFVAHLVARNRLWSGHCVAVMNAPWVGPLRLGPRAHPNDGILDVTVGRLGLRERYQAYHRAKTGTHLPHPALTMSRVKSKDLIFERPTAIYADGVRVAKWEELTVELIPDALILVG